MTLGDGSTFAGYRILRLLGAGGMGEVYLARHPRLPRLYALKVLPPSLSADSDYRDRFNREADLAAELYHPHVVGVHDRGEHENQLWIAMDYIDGSDCDRLLQDRYPAGMPAEDALEIVRAVADALDYAHQKGLLHRDVKPANILVTQPDGDKRLMLLADFGIARQLGDIQGMTATNVVLGTVNYAAPEQLMGEPLDGRADQYALAVSAYQLLTGTIPFNNSNPAVAISHKLNRDVPVPTIASKNAALAPLDPVFAVALAKDPGDRFPSCSAFARALQQATTPRPASATAPTVAAPAEGQSDRQTSKSRPPQRWLVPTALLGASILIAVVALAWRPWHQAQPSTAAVTTAIISPSPTTASSTVTATPHVAPQSNAAPTATKVITLTPVVNGQPANGFHEGPPPGNSHEVFGCDTSPAAVSFSIYKCYPSAADADVCWPSMPGTLLCMYTPWDKRLYRAFYTDSLPTAEPPPTPEPFALLLDDGTQCRLRNGGAWGGRDDNYWGAYGCPGEDPAVLVPAQSTAPAVDRSTPLWTVKVGPLGSTDAHFPPPETHTVITAYFAGN